MGWSNVHDETLVVLGGSAGALRAVRRIVAALPPGFPPAMLVVIHYPDDAPSSLAGILARSGPLPAATLDGEQLLVPGHIGVGPPGRHVIVRDHHTVLGDGPRENGQRPSIDVLFRSAARAFGPRAIGVIVSGTLDDGALGLAEVVRCGGRAIVQAPEDAEHDSMPRNAIRAAATCDVLPAADIAARLVALAAAPWPPASQAAPAPAAEAPPTATRLTCPACGSPLGETHGRDDAFRCPAGHAFTIGTLADSTRRESELALRGAIRIHDERVDVLGRLETAARERRDEQMADTYQRLAADARDVAARLRSVG